MADKKLEAEKLITQYDERLREIRDMDISEISLEEIEQLCTGFEQEMNTLEYKGQPYSQWEHVHQSRTVTCG